MAGSEYNVKEIRAVVNSVGTSPPASVGRKDSKTSSTFLAARILSTLVRQAAAQLIALRVYKRGCCKQRQQKTESEMKEPRDGAVNILP